jgi:hypothetical protein
MTYPCRRPVRSCVAILVVLLSTAATPCFAEWRRLDSPNFVVVGGDTDKSWFSLPRSVRLYVVRHRQRPGTLKLKP